MKRFRILAAALLLALSAGTAWLAPDRAAALSGVQFQASRIVDDGIFFNPSTMSVGAIQAFLNAKVPVCDTWHAPSGSNSPPFTCLKDFRQDTPFRAAEPGLCSGFNPGNKSAAEIIFEVSRSCGVNPQVLIVLLQKEQALVTDTWPWAIQYRSATGYGCPDSAPCDAEYYGFFNQVYAAARQSKRYLLTPQNFNYRAGFNNFIRFNPNTACGGSTVYIENYATAGLYNYTPYQPNGTALNNLYGTGDGCSAYGNRNFWRLFNDWFGTTFGTVLLRGSGHTIYVRGANPDVAYGVPSGEALKAYGLQSTPVTSVGDSYLASLNTSSMLSTLFRRPLDQTVFLADAGTAYGIASGDHCTKWGLPCDVPSLISDLPYGVTNPLILAAPINNLMRFDNTTFVMENGIKKPFIKAEDKALSAWSNENPIPISSPLNSGQPSGAPLLFSSFFFRLASGSIFYHSSGQYFTFSSFENFKSWMNNSLVLSDKYSTFNAAPPAATTLPNFSTDGTTVTLLNGPSRYILPAGTSVPAISTNTYPALNSLIAGKQVVAIDETKALGLPNGTIVTLQNGTLRPIPSMSDLTLLFSPMNVLAGSGALLDAYNVGKLYITPGRIVKQPNNGAMYLYGDDGYLWALGNIGELNATLTWMNNVVTSSFSNFDFQGIKIFSTALKMNGNYYGLQGNGTARQLPNPILTTQKDALSAPITGTMTGRIPIDSRPVGFIRFDNGTIFKIEGSAMRPLSSLATYFAHGGNSGNTAQMSLKSLNAFTIGDPL